MSIKLVVLYPRPIDEAAFEQKYHDQHVPLVRRFISPPDRVKTYTVRLPHGCSFYRLAEIEFPSLAEATAFGNSEHGKFARRSSESVAVESRPIAFVCEGDPP